MSNNINSSTLLIGAGEMAMAYAKVLQTLGVSFVTIGRGQESAGRFTEKTGLPAYTGGIENNIELIERYNNAIVAVNVDQLADATISLINHGVQNILVEKPGGLNLKEIEEIKKISEKENVNIYIAYNRRFYASVFKAKELIEDDGGVISFQFDFTEWSHIISKLPSPASVKENWFLANSTHVIDLAFFLGGKPKEMVSNVKGSLDWHPNASVYCGTGITKNGALFSYHSNWESPGRWGIELSTKNHKLILRPIEALQIQRHGSVAIETVDIEDSLDKLYKPGLYRQTQAFFRNPSALLSIKNHYEFTKEVYAKIGNLK